MKRAFSLIELLVVLGIMGIFLGVLPQFIPSFNSTGASRSAFGQLATRGRLEALNRENPVVLAYNPTDLTWALWELDETPVEIDKIRAQKDGFDPAASKSDSEAALGETRVKALDGEDWVIWQYPTPTAAGASGGIISYLGTQYLFNAVGNLVTIEQ